MAIFQGFVGATYSGTSRNVDAERCINLYPEVSIAPGVKAKTNIVLYPTPGLSVFATVGAGPIRAMFYQDSSMYVISGAEAYSVTAAAGSTLLGAVTMNTQPGWIGSNGSGGNQIFFISGGNGYIWNTSTSAWAQISVAGFPSNVPMGAFSDGYFLVMQNNTRTFQFSTLFNGALWAAGDVAQKSQTSDNIRALIVNHKEIWLFGSKTTEVWYNTGDTTTPFAPIQGVLIEHGIGPVWSAVKIDNSILWIGQDEHGIGQVWRAEGYTPARISNHAIEQAWNAYASIDDAIAWGYQDRGHAFYVVTFPDAKATWAFDLATSMWHERSYLSAGVRLEHLARFHAFAFSKHLVGDRVSANIYEQSASVYSDNGAAIQRVRRTPHVNSEARYLIYDGFQLDMQPGFGLTTGQGSDPLVMLRVSRDGGYTWGNERTMSVGAIGNYKTRAIARILGRSRDTVFEVTMTDPVPMVWTDAYLEVRAGTS